MGLFEKLFPKTSVNIATNGYFRTLTAYEPRFYSFDGGIYEADLCRSAIHSFATHCAKLKLEVIKGGKTEEKLKYMPNQWMDTYKFLYILATILECENTAFIIPILDKTGENVLGLYPTAPTMATIIESGGKEYVKFTYPAGVGVVELKRVGILTKYQYKDMFFGAETNALKPTLDVLSVQNQGIVEAVKSSASIRFLAKIAQTLKPSDIEAERKRFITSNLNTANNGGVMIVDAKYSDVKNIDSKPMIIDDKQMQVIKNNVYSYFGTNENILMNNYNEEQWAAYYEGKIEPFAIQLSLVLTNMLYKNKDMMIDNEVILSANRLQYASNAIKLNIVTQLFDRGMITMNQGLEIFNLSSVKDGDKRYIRKEYAEVDKLNESQGIDIRGDDFEN